MPSFLGHVYLTDSSTEIPCCINCIEDRNRDRETEADPELEPKTLILKDSRVKSVRTYLTASP